MSFAMASPPTDLHRTLSADRKGRQYSDEEWDRVKGHFYHIYMEKNFTLKEAAKWMKEHHNFDATQRQWERRIAPNKWNFTKFARREDRLNLIESAGKTLQDVSQRGRRRSTGSSDGRSLLDDRNIRRFARRELSREPSRNRAASVSSMADEVDHAVSTAAPSPAGSDYMMDTQQDSFSQTAFRDVDDLWQRPSFQHQDSTVSVPEIRIIESLPAITFSGPDEPSFIAPDHIPSSSEAQGIVDYPQTQGSAFDAFRPLNDGVFGNSTFAMAQREPEVDMAVAWNDPSTFTADISQPVSSFPGFDFGSDTVSFTQMMGIGDRATAPVDTNLEAFDNFDLQLAEPVPTPITPSDAEPSFDDPTHVDVHALLQEHYSNTLKMLSMCITSCDNTTGNAGLVKQAMLDNLWAMANGLESQNAETDRKVKTTLKDISSTQRRATQSIRDLSFSRKKKIEQLQAEIGQLQAQVQALSTNDSTFTYG